MAAGAAALADELCGGRVLFVMEVTALFRGAFLLHGAFLLRPVRKPGVHFVACTCCSKPSEESTHLSQVSEGI
jgi:hypothetical protein